MILTLECLALNALARELARAPEILAAELRDGMERSVLAAEAEIVDRTPVDKGRLRASINTRVEGSGTDLTGIVATANVPYAVYQEYGTGIHSTYPGAPKAPYTIHARNVKALRFKVGGKVLFRRSVTIQGMRGKAMFRLGAEAALPQIERIFQKRLENVARRLSGA